jgi:hypothetical protein
MTTLAEKKHMAKVADLGCVVCMRVHGPHEPGPVELHHPRAGVGMGKRSSHWMVLPLCVDHHRGNMGIHGMGRKAFESHYGFTEMNLLDDVRQKTA